ncbi:ADP-ribosylglycohydrolase family protein [Bacillus mangrovi]|uniref:ADP-ribosylglycohydrolase family protein n=1 Tax=Metabacillus mangrovi TaxID=1491830 RepID=A0A7X2S7I5_9BACI|nr:ADP-ribosylglycohydrolase family protein [Metabacillus mangrovi]MTH55067.1 ADP-ribosylglycohydrolase family protein [Metabacillus mangrovi]
MERGSLEDKWKDDSVTFLKIGLKKRLMPALYGGIVGDLLGVPVEFKSRGSFRIQEVTGYGTYNQPPGTWSDDTSLTLCLIENLLEDGDAANLLEKFNRYRTEGYMTPYGEMFDIGRTTIESISRYQNGLAPRECGGGSEFDNGNGAVMRIAPLAFTLYKNFNFIEKAEVIKKYSEVTHSHPRSIVGSIIYIEFLIRIYHNNDPETALQQIGKLFADNFNADHPYTTELQHYSRLFSPDFFDLPESEIRSDGYVVHTLEAAIWCLGNTSSFKEAVLKAVNLGDDTDTVASITGTMAGILYKVDGHLSRHMDAIPAEWLDAIAKKDEVDELLNRFFEFCAEKAIKEEYGE